MDKKISQLPDYPLASDVDLLPIVDTTNTTTKKITWANLKATLRTYFNTLYPSGSGTSTGTNTGDQATSTAPTASTIASFDANSNLSALNLIEGYRLTSTTGGTTTLVVGDAYQQVFSGSSSQTVKLPTTGVAQGQQYQIVNLSTNSINIVASDSSAIITMNNGTSATFTANGATPTTNTSWTYSYFGLQISSGKRLLVNNTLTLAGTDGTTMTFPSTSSTVVTTAQGNIAGTATNLSGTPALPNGTTATTQSAKDNSTKLATTAYADALIPGAWTAWTPSFTGFSINPTVVARYVQIGKTVTVQVYTSGVGTSNATTFTITLPIAAANIGTIAQGIGAGVDAGAPIVLALATTNQNSTTCNIYKNVLSGGWTATGTKYVNFSLTYESI
jgi:hypothetical protein